MSLEDHKNVIVYKIQGKVLKKLQQLPTYLNALCMFHGLYEIPSCFITAQPLKLTLEITTP